MFITLLVALFIAFSMLSVVTTIICVIVGARESPERRRMEDDIQANVLAAYHKR